MQAQQNISPSPILPQVKTADLMFPRIFSSMITMTIQVTCTLQSMKQWNLYFFFIMFFTGLESVNSLSALFKMGGGGKVQNGSLLVSCNTFWLLVLILFPHSCKFQVIPSTSFKLLNLNQGHHLSKNSVFLVKFV